MTRGAATGLAAAGSTAAFGAAFYWRLNAAYGPFNLSLDSRDWMVLWELWRHGQIAGPVVAQGLALGAAAALVPWLLVWRARRREPR